MPEPLAEQLEERTGRGIRIDDEDGGHACTLGNGRGNSGC
jgi:hypothetical protein